MGLEGLGFEPWEISPDWGRMETEFNLVANDSIKHAYITNSNKNSKHWSSGELLWLVILCVLSYINMHPQGQWKLRLWDPLRAHPMHLSLWIVLILYPFAIIKAWLALFWVQCVVLANYQTWGSHGNPQICTKLIGSKRSPEVPQTCGWYLKWGQSCGGLWP